MKFYPYEKTFVNKGLIFHSGILSYILSEAARINRKEMGY